MKLLKINGTELEVMDYLWSVKEIDIDSGRNLKGVMERDIAEHHPITLKVTFPPQNQTERQRVLNLINHPYLETTCFSPLSGTMETHTLMHGDLDSQIYWSVESINGDDGIMYQSFSVDLVEY